MLRYLKAPLGNSQIASLQSMAPLAQMANWMVGRWGVFIAWPN